LLRRLITGERFDLFLGAFLKLRKPNISFAVSICPSPWNKSHPLKGFSLNLIFEDFSKICRENLSFFTT